MTDDFPKAPAAPAAPTDWRFRMADGQIRTVVVIGESVRVNPPAIDRWTATCPPYPLAGHSAATPGSGPRAAIDRLAAEILAEPNVLRCGVEEILPPGIFTRAEALRIEADRNEWRMKRMMGRVRLDERRAIRAFVEAMKKDFEGQTEPTGGEIARRHYRIAASTLTDLLALIPEEDRTAETASRPYLRTQAEMLTAIRTLLDDHVRELRKDSTRAETADARTDRLAAVQDLLDRLPTPEPLP